MTGKAIYVGRLEWSAVIPDRIPTEIIGHDEDDIRYLIRIVIGGRGKCACVATRPWIRQISRLVLTDCIGKTLLIGLETASPVDTCMDQHYLAH